jgi:hypothetical protein
MYSQSISEVYLLNLGIRLDDRKKIKIDVMLYIDFLLIKNKKQFFKRTHARQLGLTNVHGLM